MDIHNAIPGARVKVNATGATGSIKTRRVPTKNDVGIVYVKHDADNVVREHSADELTLI